jgi:hypothetical protein
MPGVRSGALKHRTRAGVPGVPAQAKLLPEHARPQDRARRQ